MRTYYIEAYLNNSWTKRPGSYDNCAKASRICKHLQKSAVAPLRVIMSMRPVSIKDLHMALVSQARRS
jgi:hypothetical protein